MAIDSLRKRASIASLGLLFLGPSVVPDGSIAAEDRQAIGGGYYGISVGAGDGGADRRKRASIAALGLPHYGPSVVPDGSFVQGDRQAIANSYYGITAGAGENPIEVGATSQLEAFAATGGITLEITLGATNQLAAFDATGGITLERTLGATSQLQPFTSSGGIQFGDFVGAGGTPNRLKKKRESLEGLRRASQLALLRRRKAEELEAKVQAQLEVAVPAGKTIEYDPQVMRIAKISDKIDQDLAIAFEAKRQAEEEQEQTRKRRARDKLAVMLLLH